MRVFTTLALIACSISAAGAAPPAAATHVFRVPVRSLVVQTAPAPVADVQTSASLTFGNVPLALGVTQSLVLRNVGSAPAPLSLGALEAPFAAAGDCPEVLTPAQSCTLSVTYTPGAPGSHEATMVLADGKAVALTGRGILPSLEADGAGRRWTNHTYASSCEGYRRSSQGYAYAGATGSGVYTVDTDGPGPRAPIQAYCDMTHDGGGWTLMSNQRRGAGFPLDFHNGLRNQWAIDPTSTTAGSGALGVDNWSTSFPFTHARIEVVASDDTDQVAAFYKTITQANVATWAVDGAAEPDATQTCTDAAMSSNCTSRGFSHNAASSATLYMWGVELPKYGYEVGHSVPVHGDLKGNHGGWCSVTIDLNDNAWADSGGDGHWGNGLRIWMR